MYSTADLTNKQLTYFAMFAFPTALFKIPALFLPPCGCIRVHLLTRYIYPL